MVRKRYVSSSMYSNMIVNRVLLCYTCTGIFFCNLVLYVFIRPHLEWPYMIVKPMQKNIRASKIFSTHHTCRPSVLGLPTYLLVDNSSFVLRDPSVWSAGGWFFSSSARVHDVRAEVEGSNGEFFSQIYK